MLRKLDVGKLAYKSAHVTCGLLPLFNTQRDVTSSSLTPTGTSCRAGDCDWPWILTTVTLLRPAFIKLTLQSSDALSKASRI